MEEKIQSNPIFPDNEPEEREDTTELDETVNYEMAARDWLSGFGQNAVFNCTLLKLNGDGGKPIVCDNYAGEIPQVRDIGLNFGSGRYEIVFTSKTSEKRKKRCDKHYFVTLHDIWDKRKAEYEQKLAKQISPVNSGNNVDPLELSFKMMDRLMGYFAAMNKNVAPVQQPMAAGMIDVLENNYKKVDKMIADVYAKKIEMMNIFDSGDQDDTEEEKEERQGNTMANNGSLAGLVQQFMPMIMGLINSGNGDGLDKVLNNPAVSELLKNPNELKQAIDILDKKVGVTAVNKMLKAAKIQRP